MASFPVLISLGTNLAGFSYSQFASPSGGDLRFSDAGGMTLFHEIDQWNTNGLSSVWVQVPALAGTNDGIWAWWGNPLATNPPAWTTNGAAWLPSHELVWHLKEARLPYADSVQRHPAAAGSAPVPTPAGILGRAQVFDGNTAFLDAGTISLGNEFTLSAWVRVDTNANNIQTIWSSKNGGYQQDGLALFLNSWQSRDQKLVLETGNGTGGISASTAAGLVAPGQWHYIAAAVNRTGGTARLYIDGADRTQSSAIVNDFGNSRDLNLGRFPDGNFHFQGVLDEVRIARQTCSSNWIWASWMTVASNSTFASYATVENVVVLNPSSLNQVYDGSPKVVMAGTTPPGLELTITYNGNATPPTGAGSYAVVATVSDPNYPGLAFGTLTVLPAPLTVTGIAATNKVYDSTTNATINTAGATLNGVLAANTGNVTLAISGATGAFADRIVGNNKPVTVSGLALTGADAGNYILTQPTLMANIMPAGLAISGLAANSKVYDGTTDATITGTPVATEVVASDAVSVSGTATGVFADRAVSNNKPLTPNITLAVLTVTGVTAANKVYDGTTSATINTSSATLNGVLAADTGDVTLVTSGATGTFADKSVGAGKLEMIIGLTLSGSEADNYALYQPSTTADIIAIPELTIANLTLIGLDFSVSVSSVLGSNYTLEYKNSLTDAKWTAAQTLSGTGGTITLTDGVATTSARFYRVRVE